MRILLILTEFPPSFGGMQTHAVHLCHYWQALGHDLHVATYRSATPDPPWPFPVHRCLSRVSFRENLRVLARMARAHRAEAIYASTIFYGHLRAMTGLPVIARSAGNDILRPWIAWPYRTGSRALAAPWIEDRLYARFRRLDWPERVENWLIEERRRVAAASARQLEQVLANSHYTGDRLTENGLDPERVRVVPGGVDAAHFRPGAAPLASRRELGLPEDRHLLLTACRLVPKKGIETLLEAVARTAGVHLAIAGDGRHRSRYERAAAGLPVTFLGAVPHARLREYYWAADQFVLASREHVDPRTGLRDVETMGRVLCEANAAGVPVIASRTGGIPSVIDHGANGLLVAEDAPEQLAQAIALLRDDPDLRARLRHRGLERARREFDWSVVFAAHDQALRPAPVRASVPSARG